MKNITSRAAALLLMALVTMPIYADKKKNDDKKKERKAYEWVMPELTGNEDFDKYLLTCDTLYNRVKTYSDSIIFYHVCKINETDKAGNPVMGENGKQKQILAVVDDSNHIRGTMEALSQYASMAKAGANILLDLANITIMTASATTALPSLGIKAFSYGKYVKAGPKIMGMCTSEVKEILDKTAAQRKAIRALRSKAGNNEQSVLIDGSIDMSNIDGVNFNEIPEISKTSEDIAKEMAAAAAKDSSLGDFKDDEEI